MGVVSPVSEILLPFKNGQISLLVHGLKSSKNSIDRNRLKKNYASRDQCHVHVHQFWWACDLSGFRDMATFQKRPNFPFGAWTIYSPWSSKILINRNQLKKFMQVGIDINMHAHQFWWVWVSPVSKILLPFKNGQISLWGMDYSPWSSKNLINRNRLKKIMQVGVDIKCMQPSFDGHGLSGFRDIATFQKQPNFPFGAWTI